MRQIILDTETTGLVPQEGHRVIEIGCVELINRRFTGNNFHQYINPEREVEAGALKVHGISNSFLRNKPIFADVYDEFRAYVDGAELVIHNAPFDVGFLNHEFKLLNRKNKDIETNCSILDTLAMARKMHPGQRNSLDALCKRYHVSNANRKLHGALLDAEILAEVYLCMTGGQNSLFDVAAKPVAETEEMNSESMENIAMTKKGWDLPVIKATPEELLVHDAYMEKIKPKDN